MGLLLVIRSHQEVNVSRVMSNIYFFYGGIRMFSALSRQSKTHINPRHGHLNQGTHRQLPPFDPLYCFYSSMTENYPAEASNLECFSPGTEYFSKTSLRALDFTGLPYKNTHNNTTKTETTTTKLMPSIIDTTMDTDGNNPPPQE